MTAVLTYSEPHAIIQGRSLTAEDLLQLIARGDTIAFGRLYDLVASRVYGLAHRTIRDAAQAEEIAQEVFVEIWTKATRFDCERGSALSWIMMITHRKAVDRVRHSQKSRERDHLHSVSGFERDHDNAYEQVHDEIEQTLDRVLVAKALLHLTPLQLQAIELAFYDGQTYPAIARLLQVPLSTVKTRIRDGLVRIRRHCDKPEA